MSAAAFNLGEVYLHGEGVKQNLETAENWYLLAIELGFYDAKSRLVDINRLRFTKGDRSAAARIGNAYLNGEGVEKNIDEAKWWFEKASEARIADGYYGLAQIYKDTSAEDYHLYLNKAASSGSPSAMRELYEYYKKSSTDKAIIWLKQCAYANDPECQYLYSLALSRGEGIKQSFIEAYAWAKLVENSILKAKWLLNDLKNILNKEEIEEAESLAQYLFGADAIQNGNEISEQALRWRVTQVQSKLKLLGYYDGEIDGLLGPNTLSAINNFKANTGIESLSSDISSGLLARLELALLGFSTFDEMINKNNSNIEIKSTGTGFFVNHDAHIVTNSHVVDDCSTITIRINGKNIPVALLDTDPIVDLALLKSNLKNINAVPLRTGERPDLGEEIIVLGFPFAGVLTSDLQLTTGVISGTSGIFDRDIHYQLTAAVQPGNSGGPLLDYSGNVIGVIVSKLNLGAFLLVYGTIPENINFAIKLNALKKFLDDHRAKYIQGPATRRQSSVDIGRKGRKYTFLVACWR